MGIFDSIFGKKSPAEEIALEPCDGGYILANRPTRAPCYDRACVFFSSPEPIPEEQDVVISLIEEHRLAESLAPDTLIATVYEAIPDIDEYLDTQEMPDGLNAFLMARAMMNGLARSQAEMGKLTVYPLYIQESKGVLVLKEI